MRDRTVCWFSCGAASALATKFVCLTHGPAGEHAHRELVIARCIVREEHPDNDRFAADCEKWFGFPILNLMNEDYDGSIYEVFRKRAFISGPKGAPCTRLLKREVREQFQRVTDTHVFGYCAEEQERFDRFLDANNIEAFAPLINRGLTHADALAMVQDAGIRLPTMYELGYKHNNCRGCCKATGQGYWNKVRIDFPDMFDRMAKESRRLGAKIIRIHGERRFLDELQPGTGDYNDEPEIQCGVFCEMGKAELGQA